MHQSELTGTIPYSPTEAMNLRGSNELSAKDAFYERKKYKDLPLFLDTPHPLRSWYTSYYYGRVDPIQNGIVVNPVGPAEWAHRQVGMTFDPDSSGILQPTGPLTTYEPNGQNTLKQVKSSAGNVFVFNFVADAFKDLKEHLQRAGDADLINKFNSVYYKLEPVRGFENYDNSFRGFNRAYGTRFTNWIRSSKSISNRVLDFPSFVKELSNYMGTKLNDWPITLTGYVVSNYSSPMISGLSLELKKNPDYAKDSPKFENYILDPNFDYFVKAARKYGFYVDRNGPWKITADPLSEPMLAYMTKTFSPTCEQIGGYFDAPSRQQFFNTYYQKTYKKDLLLLKDALLKMYNQFAQDYPRATIQTTSTVKCPNRPSYEVRMRNTISKDAVHGLGSLFWLHTYFNIRTREANVTFTDYNQKIQMINTIYKTYNEETAMRYINNLIKPYLYNLQVGKKVLTKEKGPVKIGSVENARTAPTHVGPRGVNGGGVY